MFDSIPDPIVGVDADGTVVVENRVGAALRLNDDAPPAGLSPQQQGWRAQLTEAIERFAANEGPLDELQSAIGVDVSVVAKFSDLVMLAIRRTPAMKAMQEELALMKQVFDMTPSIIFAKDLEGRYTLANSKTLEMIGRPLEEVTQLTFQTAFPESDRRTAVAEWERHVVETGESINATNIMERDGELRHYALQLFPLTGKGGDVEGFAGIATDQTDQLRQERENREREERFRLAFDHAIGGMALLDLEGNIERSNPQLASMLNIDVDELIGTAITSHLHPDDRAELVEFLRDSKSDELSTEVRFRTSDNFDLLTEASFAVVRSIDAAPIQLVMHIADVTERRALEEHARQTEKLQIVDQLAGAIAHDINNVLGVIVGHVDLLRDSVSTDEALEDIDAIVMAANRASGYTQRLLNYTRNQPVQPVEFAIDDVTREVGAMLKRSMPADITLEVHPDGRGALVHGETAQIQSAILNLTLNARDALSGPGKIIISTRIEQRDGGHVVQIAITDTGVGISADMQRRIFEPFFTTKSELRGTGLGLTSVLSTAHSHGGTVRVVSEPGEGSTFTLELPVAGFVDTIATREFPSVPERKRVLVVDDDPLLRRLLKRGLSRNDFEAVLAEDGEAAIKELESGTSRIDMILFDLKMPRMDGVQLHSELKARWPDTPSFLMTGNIQDPGALTLQRSGVAALQKPFRIDQVLELLRVAKST